VEGLYNLAKAKHSIEIRYVLNLATAPRIKPFVEFVYRNLPFVSHVAFMGLEPMGCAKRNRDLLWERHFEIADAALSAFCHVEAAIARARAPL
jgi:hypothetical protein